MKVPPCCFVFPTEAKVPGGITPGADPLGKFSSLRFQLQPRDTTPSFPKSSENPDGPPSVGEHTSPIWCPHMK